MGHERVKGGVSSELMGKKANQETLGAGDAAAERKVTEESWPKRLFPELRMKVWRRAHLKMEAPNSPFWGWLSSSLDRNHLGWCLHASQMLRCPLAQGSRQFPKKKKGAVELQQTGRPWDLCEKQNGDALRGSTYIEREVKEMK